MSFYFTTDHYLSSVDMTAITQMNYCAVGCHCEISSSIDTTYQNIVQLLHSAAHDHCPLTTGSFFKSYWDEEMSELKQRSTIHTSYGSFVVVQGLAQFIESVVMLGPNIDVL